MGSPLVDAVIGTAVIGFIPSLLVGLEAGERLRMKGSAQFEAKGFALGVAAWLLTPLTLSVLIMLSIRFTWCAFRELVPKKEKPLPPREGSVLLGSYRGEDLKDCPHCGKKI